jgi:Tfp pilus assembly protein PilF
MAGALLEQGQYEAALAESDAALAIKPDSVMGFLNRGLACKALRRWSDAASAFRAVLAAFPDFAAVHVHIASMYAELDQLPEAENHLIQAIALEPSRAAAHANLGTIYMRMDRYDLAEAPVRRALELDPDIIAAHQNLAAILAKTKPEEAQKHRDAAYERQQIFVEPSPTAVRSVLLITAANDGNVPYIHLLPRTRYTLILWYAEYAPEGQERTLPPHDIVFNAVGDPDASPRAQQAAARFAARTTKPLLNRPDRVARTHRSSMPELFGGISSLVVPAVARLVPDGRTLRAAVASTGIPFPVIVRRAGTHGGTSARLVVSAEGLPDRLFDDVTYVTKFVDSRSVDGNYRKYRVIFVDRVPYPYHLAISSNWLVHHATAGMDRDSAKRSEEAMFLADPEGALGSRAMTALHEIGSTLDLDYAGIDFSLLPDGRILFFEANATMLVHPETTPMYAYKNAAVQTIADAVTAMIERRLAAQR